MTTRYRCPISTCAWSHDYVASGSVPDIPSDLLSWTRANWADMSERINGMLAAAHVIDAHLVTHSPVQWMAELRLYQARAEDAESEADRLRIVVEKTAFLADAVDPLTTRRLPSRVEIETVRELLANAAGGAVDV